MESINGRRTQQSKMEARIKDPGRVCKRKEKRIGHGERNLERGLQREFREMDTEKIKKERGNDIFQVFGGNAIAKQKENKKGSPRQSGLKRAPFTWYHKRRFSSLA
jgi:hypothetical protein